MNHILYSFLMAGALFAQTTSSTLSRNYEGSYSVRVECRENEPEPCKVFEVIHKMIIMTTPGDGISLAIARNDIETEFYSFPALKLNPQNNKLEGMGINNYAMRSDISLEWDNGSVLGWIRDPRFQNDLRLTGQMVENTTSLYLEKSSPALEMGDVIGVYHGKMKNGLTIKLNLQNVISGAPNQLQASALLSNIAYMYFSEGKLDSVSGVINLWSELEHGLYNKWTLKFKSDGKKRTLEGVSLMPRKGGMHIIALTRSEGP
jgi:hypothetical protein